jgi:hypothetical protein
MEARFQGRRKSVTRYQIGDSLYERDVLNTWRNLFDGKEVTTESLAKAETLLDGLSGESPLQIRLAKELEEMRDLQPKE